MLFKTKNKSARKVEDLGKSLKDLDDKVFLLENIVKNRDSEIDRLRKELDSFQATTSSDSKNCDDVKETTSVRKHLTCDDCDFADENEQSMKLHMKKNHEVECETCNEILQGLGVGPGSATERWPSRKIARK